jgi:hypothetical protein
MKRSILAVAAVLALGSASAFAQTADVLPSFNDAPDLDRPAPTPSVSATDNTRPGASTADNNRSSAGATANDRRSANTQDNARYAHSSHGSTRSDANPNPIDGTDQPTPTLNDSFHYPSSD